MYRPLVLLFSLALFGAANARSGPILYYTGDPNGQTAYGDYQDLSGKVNVPESQVFQNFIVSPGFSWNLSSMYLNEIDLGPSNVTEAVWSIRTGMGPGNGGTILYSGTSPATEGPGSISQVTVSGLNITLPPGQYWMNITPQTNGTKLLAAPTSGVNAIGATLTQSGLWYESRIQNYTSVQTDFSMGLVGNLAVASPEPATWFLMATALSTFAIFFRKSAIAVRVARSTLGLRK